MGKFWVHYKLDWKMWRAWAIKKAAISLKRVKIEEMLLRRAYRNSPTLFRTVPSTTPYCLLFPKIGGSQPPKFQSLSQERVKLRTSNLACTFKGSANKSPLKIWKKGVRDRIQGLSNFLSTPYYLKNELRSL